MFGISYKGSEIFTINERVINLTLQILSIITNKNHRKTTKNRNRITSIAVLLWCHRESNQGHKDFQSFALPTELWHQIFFRTTLSFDWDCKGRHFFLTCKFFLTNFQKIYTFLRFGLFFHEFRRNLSQFKVRPRMKWEYFSIFAVLWDRKGTYQ